MRERVEIEAKLEAVLGVGVEETGIRTRLAARVVAPDEEEGAEEFASARFRLRVSIQILKHLRSSKQLADYQAIRHSPMLNSLTSSPHTILPNSKIKNIIPTKNDLSQFKLNNEHNLSNARSLGGTNTGDFDKERPKRMNITANSRIQILVRNPNSD